MKAERTVDEIHRMGFLEKVILEFEKHGRALAEAGKEWEPPLKDKPEDSYASLRMHSSAAYLSETAYSKRKARLERMKA